MAERRVVEGRRGSGTVPFARIPTQRQNRAQARGTGLPLGPTKAPPTAPPTTDVWKALRGFMALSLVCLVVVMLTAAMVGERIARNEALREARTRAGVIADTIAAPLISEAVRNGQPTAVAKLEDVMTHRIERGKVEHIKLWAADGRVIWSDEKAIIGKRYTMPDDVKELFGTRGATAEVSDLSKSENQFERHEGELVEVYAGAFDADGEPVVFEAYAPTDQMRADQKAITWELLLLAGSAVLLLEALLLPIAVRLARRVERGEVERSALARHAVRASDLERRRIAQDLHDGVIQDLAGLGYALPALSRYVPEGPDGDRARETIDRITGIVQRDVAALRTTLIEVTPPDLHIEGGLRIAVLDLCKSARDADVDVDLTCEADDLPEAAASLAYRVAREGLRNVVKHAPGSTAGVVLARQGDLVEVCVRDSGPGAPPGPVKTGHKGLQLLRDTLRDVGGQLDFVSRPGATMLRATFPITVGQH